MWSRHAKGPRAGITGGKIMTSYKDGSLIPSRLAEKADRPPSETARAGPDQQVPLVPAVGPPIAPPSSKQPEAAGIAGSASDLWRNGRWAVTEAGFESRYGHISYSIEKE